MDETTAPPPPLPPKFRWRRRVAWTLGLLVLLVIVLLIAAGSGVWWTLRSEAGAAWALSRLPGFQVTGGKGTLWGDYSAQRVEFSLANGTRIVLDDVAWKGMHLQRADWASYRTGIVMSELRARRAEVVPAPTVKKDPAKPPAHLRFPVEIDIGAFRVGEFHMPALGGKPLRDVQARIHLGDERGGVHVVDKLSLAWDKLRATGSGRINTDAPFALDVKLDLAQQAAPDATAWQARTSLSGQLAQPVLSAQVQAQPAGGRPAQSLELRAGLRPFAAWPLGELQATTKSLDLSAFLSGAPVTSLSGSANATSSGLDLPATVTARLANADAGRWNEGKLPVRELALQLNARPNDPRTLDLRQVDAALGTREKPAGRVQGEGRWTPKEWRVDAQLQGVQPSLLDARATPMVLSGPLSARVTGADQGLAGALLELKTQLEGQFAARGPARSARLALDATASSRRIELRQAELRMGQAQASLKATGTRDSDAAPWHAKGDLRLVDFDPSPWWPGADDSPLRKGPNRLNAQADFDVTLAPAGAKVGIGERLAALRGRANVGIGNSVLAGVPLEGKLSLQSAERGMAAVTARIDAAGNRVDASGRLAAGPGGAADQWDITLSAPALNRLSPLWRLGAAPSGEETLAGTITGKAQVRGRWPQLATQGELDAQGLRVGKTSVKTARAQWRLDTTRDAALELQASASEVAFSQALFKGTPPIQAAQMQLKGTTRAHTLELRAETRALPPAWTDTLQVRPARVKDVSTAGTSTVLTLQAEGGALQAASSRLAAGRFTGWRGALQLLEMRNSNPDFPALLRTRNVSAEVQWGTGPLAVTVQPGRATLLGAALRWNRIFWQAGAGGQPPRIEAQAELEPVPVAPLLARAQPDFGWGGDLTVVGHLDIKSAPVFSADIVLERQRGDLTVTDEAGNVQALGLTDLRLGLNAQNGVWSFTQGLAGKTLGVAAGAVVARTTPQATWPSPDTPIQGVLEVQVANLGTWGPWVPAGWRLTGALRTSAGIGGRFGAPEYTGEMRGTGLGVRNFLQGVNVSDGEVAIALQGATARIDRFTAKAGNGTVRLEGDATLGESPRAQLRLAAEKFQLLGRVDRRIVTTGQAQLVLERDNVALDGKFAVDEGLFDFSRSDAPRLSDDVRVSRGKPEEDAPLPNASAAPGRTVKLDLQVDLGRQLRLRGRGIDTGLQGELRITSPNNRLAINGTVRAVDGTYAAYGQKLTIDRGLITFIGPVENPRLDIEATRPNTDIRVGVLVSGTALNPRVRLFSEPDMAEIDKLSWLVLGRASDGLGRTDTALLQRAALALLAGEGEGLGDQFTKAIGLDEVSLRQTDGEVRETVLSLGKQLSRRWYVGYERTLGATTGSWQLIYRIAQRFTLRAQTGADSSIDFIWTWRWQ